MASASGTKRRFARRSDTSGVGGEADMARTLLTDAIDPSVADSSIAPAKLSASIRSIYHL